MPKIIININNANSANPCPNIFMVLTPGQTDAAELYTDEYIGYDEVRRPIQEYSGLMTTSEGVCIMRFVGAILAPAGAAGARAVILPEIRGEALEALHAVFSNELRQYEAQYNGSTILRFSEDTEEFYRENDLGFLYGAVWDEQVSYE